LTSGDRHGGTISQVLTDVLAVDTLYTLNVEIGNANNIAFGGYGVQLLAGGALLAEDSNTLSPANGYFETSTVTFTALPGHPNLSQTLEIRLLSLGKETSFDHVRLEANLIPEPSTCASLLSLAIVGLVGFWWRRRRA